MLFSLLHVFIQQSVVVVSYKTELHKKVEANLFFHNLLNRDLFEYHLFLISLTIMICGYCIKQ